MLHDRRVLDAVAEVLVPGDLPHGLAAWLLCVHPAAVRCDMVLHRACRARHVRNSGIGGEVRHVVASGVSCETSKNNYVTPHLHREYGHVLK